MEEAVKGILQCLPSCCSTLLDFSTTNRRKDAIALSLLTIASLATTPLCYGQRRFTEMNREILKSYHPLATPRKIEMRRLQSCLEGTLFITLGAPLALLGMVFRKIASLLLDKAFLPLKGTKKEQSLFRRDSFSLLSWNIGCVGGKYAITDGGLAPWPMRIHPISQTILEYDADIVALQETIDSGSWMELVAQLKDHYAHFYVNMGGGATISSGLFVASKLKMSEARFTPFPRHMLHGRSKYSNKGYFIANLVAKGGTIAASLIVTHLGHSEEPQFPTISGEVEARSCEMELILAEVEVMQKADPSRRLIITGDLNMEEQELHRIPQIALFQERITDRTKKSWLGDQFCKQLSGGRVSETLHLDHTLILNDGRAKIETSYGETGYDPTLYSLQATSDHRPGYSLISLNLD